VPLLIAAALLSIGAAWAIGDMPGTAPAASAARYSVPAQAPTATTAKAEGKAPLFRDYRELSGTPAPSADDAPDWQVGLTLVVQLGIVLGLIYATAWGLKTLRRRTTTLNAHNSLQLMETVALTPHRTLHVVSVGDRLLILGATDHQINLITEMDTPEAGAMTRANARPWADATPAPTVQAGSSFESLLQRTESSTPSNEKTPAPRPQTALSSAAAAYAAGGRARDAGQLAPAGEAMERLLSKLQQAGKAGM
jgi:flagellar protein FliO/FliZ